MKEVSSANTSPVQPKPVSKTNSVAAETIMKASSILLDEADQLMKDADDIGCSELDFSIKIPSDGPSFDKSDVQQLAGEKLSDIQANDLITENTESTSTNEPISAVKPKADLKHSPKMQLAMLKL